MVWTKKAGDTDVEVDIHVWKKTGDEDTTDLFTISNKNGALCVDMPVDEAVDTLRRFLENLQAW